MSVRISPPPASCPYQCETSARSADSWRVTRRIRAWINCSTSGSGVVEKKGVEVGRENEVEREKEGGRGQLRLATANREINSLSSRLSSLSLSLPLSYNSSFFFFLPICRRCNEKNLSSSPPFCPLSPFFSSLVSFPTGLRGQIAREKPIYRPLRIEEVSRLNWRG